MIFTNHNVEIVACILSFRKSRNKSNLESTSKYGFSPDLGEKWWRSEHAHASYPGLSFRLPEFSPYMGREERRVQGLDHKWLYCFCRKLHTSHEISHRKNNFGELNWWNKCMLFAGWKVRIVKNLKAGRRPKAAFSGPRSQFFTLRTDPRPANNMFIFFLQ